MKTFNLLKFLSLIGLFASALWASEYSLDTEVLCHGFPRVRISSPAGTCVGMVASDQNGLKRPRRIVEISPNHFLVSDMGGWAKNIGSLWSIEIKDQGVAHIKKLLGGLDHLHGLAIDSHGLVYLGERGRISRFDPNADEIKLQVLIDDLPREGKHPLTHMIFDRADRLIVNVGAPTDQCLDDNGKAIYPCEASEKELPEAALYRYSFSESGEVKSREVLARGLRNSMALAIHPETELLFQGENNMDFKEEEHPAEELNLIEKGSHYGWPYCYAKGELNPAYKRTLFNRRLPKINCSSYQGPVALLPAHSAPLDMLFYQSDYFPELTGKLLLSFHGYRQYGHRLGVLEVDSSGLVTSKLQDFVFDWNAKEGVRPKGSPVGMSEANDGKIWFVEDKNKTVMFVARQEGVIPDHQTDSNHSKLKPLSAAGEKALNELHRHVLVPKCLSCHSIFAADSLEELHQGLFNQGLIKPSDPLVSELFLRVNGQGESMQMPPGQELNDDELELVRAYMKTIEVE